MRQKLYTFYTAHLVKLVTASLIWDGFTRLLVHPFPHAMGASLVWWKFLFFIPTGILNIPATILALQHKKRLAFTGSMAIWIFIFMDAFLYFKSVMSQ